MGPEEYLAFKFRQLKVPGFGCGISYKGKITGYYFGKSDLQLDLPVSSRSIFNIASVGKMITVACIFKLIEAKKFDLHTSIGQLLPDLPSDWDAIRIDHLLTHSSGIKNYTDAAEYWNEYHLDVPKSRIIGYVKDAGPEFAPGTRWKYSNTGFYLLGLIIEKISGKEYFEFCSELICSYRPGLKIIPTDDRKKIPGRVTGYIQQGEKLIQPPYYSNSGTFSAGGFSAVLHDFIDFESALFNGKILTDKSLQAMIHAHLKDDGSQLKSPHPAFDFSMTKGLFRFENSGKPYLAHRGEIFGFTAEYRRMINDDFSIVLAVNADCELDSGGIIDEVYRLMSLDN